MMGTRGILLLLLLFKEPLAAVAQNSTAYGPNEGVFTLIESDNTYNTEDAEGIVQVEPSLPKTIELGNDVEAGGTQIGATVFLGGWWDLEPDVDGPGTESRCIRSLEHLYELGGINKVQFTPTFFWDDVGPLNAPRGFDPSCQGSDLSTYYCYNRFNATEVNHFCYFRDFGAGYCDQVTPEEIERFQEDFGACLKKASDLGFDIEINVRVDDGMSKEGWRNTLLFDPTEIYGNYSYTTAIIDPIIQVIKDNVDHSTGKEVSLTLQGEMGASVFFYPEKWIAIIDQVREKLSEFGKSLKVGIQQNNSKLCGCFQVGFIGKHSEYLALLERDFDADAMSIDLDSVRELYKTIDYLGISAYIPMTSTEFDVCDFESLLSRTDSELAFFNMSLKEITEDFGTKLHWAETGVGGGQAQDGKTPARDAAAAAYYPYWGIQGPHSCEIDPFKMCECDDFSGECSVENEVRDYRRKYYSGLSEYLLKTDSCQYERPEAVYIWGTGSWDVLGAYIPDQSWMDPVVTRIIRDHNKFAGSIDVSTTEST